jgi:putative SOS response-associated peptidase YedK
MCGRFTQQRPTSEIAAIFDAEDLAGDEGGHFNIAPTDPAAVVVQKEDRRAVVRYQWGFQPSWVTAGRDGRPPQRPFNARAESLTSSGLFRDAFRRRRCLVPVDGFYEWRRDGKVKTPLHIHDPGRGILALAGLWTGRQDEATGEWIRSFTIVTTTPNEFMASIHDRMPVVIPPESWELWLDPTPRDAGELRALLEPGNAVGLAAYAVGTLVNNARNDGPALIQPAGIDGPAGRLPDERRTHA